MPRLNDVVAGAVHVGNDTFLPVVKGSLFPFVFITIACGAISGFHSLVGSGTTPKMVDKETDCRIIGYGAMLMEGLVGVTALLAASALPPADYFAINTDPQVAVVAPSPGAPGVVEDEAALQVLDDHDRALLGDGKTVKLSKVLHLSNAGL